MAISIVGTTTATRNNTGSIACNVPANVQNGDLLLYLLTGNGPEASLVDNPAGWTEIAYQSPYNDANARYGYRVANSEPASYTFGASARQFGSYGGIVVIFALRGIDTSDPIHKYGGGNQTWTAPAVTTTVDGCLIIRHVFSYGSNFSGYRSYSWASGTEYHDLYCGGGTLSSKSQSGAYATQANKGSTGTVVATPSNTYNVGNSYGAATFAIKQFAGTNVAVTVPAADTATNLPAPVPGTGDTILAVVAGLGTDAPIPASIATTRNPNICPLPSDTGTDAPAPALHAQRQPVIAPTVSDLHTTALIPLPGAGVTLFPAVSDLAADTAGAAIAAQRQPVIFARAADTLISALRSSPAAQRSPNIAVAVADLQGDAPPRTRAYVWKVYRKVISATGIFKRATVTTTAIDTTITTGKLKVTTKG